MSKIINVFYGYEEIAELLFLNIEGLGGYKSKKLLVDVVNTIEKTLPYEWHWDIGHYKMSVSDLWGRMDANERLRESIMKVVKAYRKELIG